LLIALLSTSPFCISPCRRLGSMAFISQNHAHLFGLGEQGLMTFSLTLCQEALLFVSRCVLASEMIGPLLYSLVVVASYITNWLVLD
jgi:hypothetical protein